jgi:hypothetical protein
MSDVAREFRVVVDMGGGVLGPWGSVLTDAYDDTPSPP